MIKKIAIAILFVSLFSIQETLAQVKIGYTNPGQVLNELPEVDEVDKQIEELISQRDEELAGKATDLQQIFSNYEASMTNLSEQERSAQEEELMQMNEQFEADRQSILNEVRQKRNELMAPIIERMNTAMEEIAKELDLDLIINEGTSNGDAIIFFAQSDRLNITNRIIEKLK